MSSQHFLIRRANVLGENVVDLRVEDATITETGTDLPERDAEVIEAEGLIAVSYTHLTLPTNREV